MRHDYLSTAAVLAVAATPQPVHAQTTKGQPVSPQTYGQVVQLPDIVITAPADAASGDGGVTGAQGPTGVKGYTVENDPVATKTKTPLVKVPASVSVITRENLDDRDVQNLTDALAYTPGAEPAIFGFDPRYDDVYIRGFDTIYDGVYRDGLRDQNAAGAGAVFRNEPYNLQAISILRGPAAATYGYGSPGGILDLTSKRPVFTNFGEIQVQFGNFSRKQTDFDFGGPVAGSNGQLAYRVTGVYREANTFPNGHDDRIDIAPALTWRPDAQTDFTLLTGFDRTRVPGSTGFFYGGNFTVSTLPEGDPAYNKILQDQYRVGYAFEHRFSADTIIRQNFRFAGLDESWRYSQIDAINPGGLTAARSIGLLYEKETTAQIDNQIEKHIDLGPTKHVLLAGLDYAHIDYSEQYGLGAAPDLDLVTLNYGSQYIADPAINPAYAAKQRQDQLGEYLQDQVGWGRATLTLSGRHDTVNTVTISGTPGTTTPQVDDALTGRAGLTYAILPGLVPYVSYATTFEPNLGVNAEGDPFAPQRGDQKEAGVKTQLPGTNLHVNAALFDIRESSVLRTDPDNLAFSIATGRVESKGYEIEAIDNIAPGTNLIAQFTHLDLRFLDDLSAPQGNQLSGIPGDSVSAFLTYRLPLPGALGGLTLGGGIRHLGYSFADDANTATNKPVTLFDALLGYDFGALGPSLRNTRLQLNAYNVFDTYSTTCQAGYCYRREPLRVIGSLVHRW